jgi:hypothetical protein
VSLKTGEIKTLVRGGYFGRYLPTGHATGHLVYIHQGALGLWQIISRIEKLGKCRSSRSKKTGDIQDQMRRCVAKTLIAPLVVGTIAKFEVIAPSNALRVDTNGCV